MLAGREERAREAAERLDRAREQGRQLSLLAAEPTPADPAELEPRGPGRRPGSRNKRTSKLRQMLAARGCRMPEDLVAEVAGLQARDLSSVDLAMARAEQVAAWLEERSGFGPMKRDEMRGLFVAIWKEQVAAAAALLPYGLEKMTPDQAGTAAPTLIVMPGSRDHAQPGDRARVIDGTMAPPPLPGETEQNQQVSGAAPDRPDGGIRTE